MQRVLLGHLSQQIGLKTAVILYDKKKIHYYNTGCDCAFNIMGMCLWGGLSSRGGMKRFELFVSFSRANTNLLLNNPMWLTF